MRIKAVFFDLGDTLVERNPEVDYDSIRLIFKTCGTLSAQVASAAEPKQDRLSGVQPVNVALYTNLLAIIFDLIFDSDQTERPSLVILRGSRGSGKTTLLGCLAAALADRSPGIHVLGPFDASLCTGDEYAHLIDNAVAALPDAVPRVVILLDNLDALARTPKAAALYAFEQGSLARLVQQQNITIVATSRTPITWRNWEIRSRHVGLVVPYMRKEDITEQALLRGLDPDDAFMLTLGHPQLLQWLFAAPQLSETDIAMRSAAYFLEGLPAATAESATLMSLLPAFDVAVLRLAAPLEGDGVAAGFYSQYLDQVHDLVAVGILSWSADAGNYQFLDSVMRCQLARSFRSQRPDDAYRVHQRVAQDYQSEARRAGVLHLCFVNVIYHLAFAAAVAGAERPGGPALAWVEKNLSAWPEARWTDVMQAWRAGGGDWVVKEELDRLLGADDIARITALLEAGSRTAAGPNGRQVMDAAHGAETHEQESVQ